MSIPAGGRANLSIAIAPLGLRPGRNLHVVRVFVRGRRQPAAVVRLTSSVQPAVVFTPPYVEFGSVPAGIARSLRLSILADPRLFRDLASVRLGSSAPWVSIRLEQEMGVTVKGRRWIARTFALDLAAGAPAGRLRGALRFEQFLPSAGAGGGELPGVLMGATAFMSGEVVGAAPAARGVR